MFENAPLEEVGNLVAVIGIILEIGGFILLLKFTRTPNYRDFSKWLEKSSKKKFKDIDRNPMNYQILEGRTEHDPVRFTPPEEFTKFWDEGKKLGIMLVILGLSFQIIQIVLSMIQ